MEFLRALGVAKGMPERTNFYPDSLVDWDMIETAARGIKGNCMAIAFLMKDYLVQNGVPARNIRFKRFDFLRVYHHVWAEVCGMVVDHPNNREAAKRAPFNLYRYGRYDTELERIWDSLN